MSNKDKEQSSVSNFDFGGVNQSGHGSATVNQGSMDTTVNMGGDTDPWEPVNAYIGAEVPEPERDAASDAVARLKEMEAAGADAVITSQFDSIMEILKPYKPVADLLVKAAPGLADMITQAFAG